MLYYQILNIAANIVPSNRMITALQVSLDCSVNFSQAPGNKNYKEEQIFILVILDPVISITVDVQGVSGWTVLVTCRANETPSL